MKVARIRIRNVMGVQDLDITPGAVTVIEGTNGAGKSSVIAALESIRTGGHDATLLRNGAERGEILIDLDDHTEIRKLIGAESSSLSVKHPTMGKISKGQTWLNELADALSFNPVEFLTCDDERRVRYILESSKLELPIEDLRAAVDGLALVPDIIGANPLRAIENIRKAIYTERTKHNTIASDSAATAKQLLDGVADVQSTTEIEAEIAELTSRETQLKAEFNLHRAGANDSVNQIEQKYDEAIDELKQRLKALEAEREEALKEGRSRRDIRVAKIDEAERNELRPITDALAAARERLKGIAAIDNTRKVAESHRQKADTAQSAAQRHTAAIARLDALKDRLLERSPIKGLDIRDGEVFYKDVPWARVNTAQRVKIALQLAVVRAGNLGLVCIDGLEALDDATFAAFVKGAVKTGLQFIVTKVSTPDDVAAGTLKVTTFDAVEAVG